MNQNNNISVCDKERQRPLVTVVTATYNLVSGQRMGHFLQCLESVRAQTYQNIEHLIVDGASTDGTLEQLQEYADKGWIRLVSEPDKGIYDAMNKGLRLATGKYISFLNSDDFWHDERGVEFSVNALELMQADFSYAGRRLVAEDGTVIVKNNEPCIGRFFYSLPFCHQTMFSRTEVLREIGGFDQDSYRMAADYDQMVRLILSRRKSVRVPLNFTSFRMGGFSTVEDTKILHKEECQFLFRRYFADYIGEEAANELYYGRYSDELVDFLADVVHPSVMQSYVHAILSDSKKAAKASAKAAAAAQKKKRQMKHNCITTWTGLLQLPLWSKRCRGAELTIYKLFAFLPMMTVRYSRRKQQGFTKRRYLLFGFLPVWKHIHHFSGTDKHYLLSFLPIWGCRQRH